MGIYILIFGWLLNIPLLIALYFFIVKPIYKRMFDKTNKLFIFIISCLVLSAIIFTTYVPGWLNFKKVCDKNSVQITNSINDVSYYYINNVNPNGPFLELNDLKGLFQNKKINFIEGPNIYKTKSHPDELPYLRYYLSNDGKFEFQKVSKLKSIYGFKRVFESRNGIKEKHSVIYKIFDDSIISKKSSFTYQGGYLSWLTFPLGVRECSNYDRHNNRRLDLQTFNLLEN